MKKLAIVCLAMAAFVGADRTSNAAPASTTLTLTTDSGVNLDIDILGGAITASIPFDLTGWLDITVEHHLTQFGLSVSNDTTGLALTGANIALSDQTIDLSAGIFGGISAEISGAGINYLSSNGYIPLNSTNGSLPYEYTFDPGGGTPTELSIDEGLFTYLGTGGLSALLGSGTLDFASDPVEAELNPVGQIGLVTQHVVVSDFGIVSITISAPITFADTLLTDPVNVDADLSGFIVATGVFVPEPSSIVLLGIAIVGLIPLWRKFRAQAS